MNEAVYQKLLQIESTQEALNGTREFLAQRFQEFLYQEEPVLIGFPDEGPKSFGGIVAQAVRDCGGVPVFWGPDYRWRELLRLAFHTHAHTVVAHPMVVLGLMKIARATSTPLYIHNVVVCGYPYAWWMLQSIKYGLDCRIWGCDILCTDPVVVGFTCDKEAGFHIREDRFEAVVRDEDGKILPDSSRGRLFLNSRIDPSLSLDTEKTARLLHQPCSCGCDAPRVSEMQYVGWDNPAKQIPEDRFLAWSSILDYRARESESGTELELVVFPDRSLPQIPSCAKLTIRNWDPEEDIPFYIQEYFQKSSAKVSRND